MCLERECTAVKRETMVRGGRRRLTARVLCEVRTDLPLSSTSCGWWWGGGTCSRAYTTGAVTEPRRIELQDAPNVQKKQVHRTTTHGQTLPSLDDPAPRRRRAVAVARCLGRSVSSLVVGRQRLLGTLSHKTARNQHHGHPVGPNKVSLSLFLSFSLSFFSLSLSPSLSLSLSFSGSSARSLTKRTFS